MKNYDFDGLKRINKKTARKIFNNGGTIRICANKINPTNEFYHLYDDIKKDYTNEDHFGCCGIYSKITFDDIINHFEYYNCNYETGYYTAFYIFD